MKFGCEELNLQNLDVVTFKLGMKVCDLWKNNFQLTNYAQFVEFWQIGHMKILVVPK